MPAQRLHNRTMGVEDIPHATPEEEHTPADTPRNTLPEHTHNALTARPFHHPAPAPTAAAPSEAPAQTAAATATATPAESPRSPRSPRSTGATIHLAHPAFQKCALNHTTRGRIIIESLIFNKYIYVHSDNSRMLAASRTLCGFNIYAPTDQSRPIAFLYANIFGTKYRLEDVLEIKYETSFLQRGKPRAFRLKLEGLDLCNKKPYFNNDTNSFSLNFSGRITRPSVKNFQVIHPLEPTYITLTFGKEDTSTYILDYTYPWSPLNAFCVGLTALDHKFGCD